MNANDLRIGNITDKGVVDCFYEKGIHVGYGKCFKFTEVNPIPLSHEWITKLGFHHSDFYGGYYKIENVYLGFKIDDEFNLSIFAYGSNERFIRKLESVHDLQNIYYAFTLTELTIKS